MLWVSGEITLAGLRPGNFGLPIVARMKPGVTTEQLAVELTQLTKELPGRFGGPPTYARLIDQHRGVVIPMLEQMVGPTLKTSLLVLLGAVAVVLLIACANVANLFLVRAESRRRDLTVRRAIGASRGQLVRLQMAEAFAVALASGVLAIVLAAVTLPVFLRAAPTGIPRLADVRLDAPTLAATFGLVLLVALACGVVPALRASSPDLTALREGGRGSTGKRAWGRDLLVVGQTALALVLLIGSALLVESFRRLRHVNPGYDIKDLYTFQYAPDQPGLRDGPSLGRLHLNMMDRLRALPGVTDVGVVNNIPLDEGTQARPGAHARDVGRRTVRADLAQLHRRRLLPHDEHPAAAGPGVHQRGSHDTEQQRDPQPLGRGEALARTERARTTHPSAHRQSGYGDVHRRRRRRRREAVRLARRRRSRRVSPAHRPDSARLGHGLAGLCREIDRAPNR